MIGTRVQTMHAGQVRVGRIVELAGEVALVRFAGRFRRAWLPVRDLCEAPPRQSMKG